MTRDYHEPRDPFDLWDEQIEQERKARVAEAERQNEIVRAQEAKAEAELRERQKEFARTTSARMIWREYQIAGVEPLSVNDEGVPRASLSLLLSMGWKIADELGQKRLVR